MNEPAIQEGHRAFNPIPSMFTLCNALCGFTAVLFTVRSVDGEIPSIGLWLVFGAMLFDALDGAAARLLKAQSLHGMCLDSLADAISFGVAPAMIIFQLVSNQMSAASEFPGLAWCASMFYLGCALWRLAQYNSFAIQEPRDCGDFIGLPSPGAAALVCAAAVLVPETGLGPVASVAAYVAYAAISAILMVSVVPYTHIRRHLTYSRRWIAPTLVAIAIASIVFFKGWAIVGWAHIYVLSAPLVALEARAMQRRHADI